MFKQIERKKLDTEIIWDNFKNEATGKIFEHLKDSYLQQPFPERKWKFEKYKKALAREAEKTRLSKIKELRKERRQQDITHEERHEIEKQIKELEAKSPDKNKTSKKNIDDGLDIIFFDNKKPSRNNTSMIDQWKWDKQLRQMVKKY